MKVMKTNTNIRSLVEEITRIGLDINSETRYCVFFNFSGHVNQFEIKVVKGKDNEEYSIPVSSEISLYLTPFGKPTDDDWTEDTNKIVEKLRIVRNKLKAFLEENKEKEPFLDLTTEEDDNIPF